MRGKGKPGRRPQSRWNSPDFFESILRSTGYCLIAGVDEVGRGALAGPVVAAAVILKAEGDFRDVRDSKVLTPKSRERLAAMIESHSIGIGIGSVNELEIDRVNILQATRRAMREAVARLPLRPDMVMVDGFWLSGVDAPCLGIVDGDARSYTIAAASIVAKVYRDRLMRSLAEEYPVYGFDRNKGYGSEFHLRAIHTHGPSPCHRQTFGTVREHHSPRGDYGR